MTFCFKKFRSTSRSKHLLQITTRTSKKSDFKFELLSLHSSLLRQFLLISFFSLIDMLKFSEYFYLIRDQSMKNVKLFDRHTARNLQSEMSKFCYVSNFIESSRDCKHVAKTKFNIKQCLKIAMTFEQTCSSKYQRAQCAFKDSMIHEILQFTLFIAFRCVFHRCQNQKIRCWKFYYYMFTRTTLITEFAWVFDELKNVNSSKQVRSSSKQHRYVDTNEKLKSIKFRLSIMILSQISRFTFFQNWNAIDHISISIHESSLCDLWIAIVLRSRLQTIKDFRFFLSTIERWRQQKADKLLFRVARYR